MSDYIEGDGYAIHFNPDTRQGMFGDADGGPETCLMLMDMPCAKDGHMWTGRQSYILKGNWMADYRALIVGGEGSKWALKAFIYDEHKRAHGSRWSYDFHEWGKDGVVRETVPSTDRAPQSPPLSSEDHE